MPSGVINDKTCGTEIDIRLSGQENMRLVERLRTKELVVVKNGEAIKTVPYNNETDRKKKQEELSSEYKN